MIFITKTDPFHWCGLEYEITPENEREHLAVCEVFQNLPVAVVKDGKTFVKYAEGIFVERVRVH